MENKVKKILLLFLLSITCAFASAKPDAILLYKGTGASDYCVEKTKLFLTHEGVDASIIDVDELSLGGFLKEEGKHYLLVVPGGSALYMASKIGQFSSLIQDKVTQGKLSYFGICAGSYLASKHYSVTFRTTELGKLVNDTFRIDGPLNLYEGESRACFDTFDPKGISGAQAAHTIREISKKEGYVFWNGGGFFPCFGHLSGDWVSVVGFKKPGFLVSNPVIIHKRIDTSESSSNMILSGIHPELSTLAVMEELEKKGLSAEVLEKIRSTQEFLIEIREETLRLLGLL